MGKDATWGYMAYLTAEQKQMLADLRKRVDAELPKKEWLSKDTELLRFCRARNFNPHKTWAMLKEDVEWREPFEGYVYVRNRDFGGAYAMHEEGAIRLAGKAKDGRPVVMVQARYYFPKLVEDNIQIVYFFTFYVDAVCKLAAQMKIAISILQNHYPERLGMIFVINAPFVFTAAWRLIQPLLDERTRSKIEILGSNYIDVISQHIDKSQIETPWGGTHEKWPIPDSIVQVAIDNEKNLIEGEKKQLEAEKAAALGAPPSSPSVLLADPPPLAATRSSSNAGESRSAGEVSGTMRKSVGVRKTVRRLMRKMLFTTEKRALANSVGADPDAPENDVPRKLSGKGSSPLKIAKAEVAKAGVEEDDADLDPSVDLEKDLFEVKEAHDKLLEKVRSMEKMLVNTAKVNSKAAKSLQRQILLIGMLVLIVMGSLVRDKFFRDSLTSLF